MTRHFNFSAGPAILPEAVLLQAKEELFDWQGSGMSVMEMSHRGKEFVSIAEQAETDLRDILQIPTNYKVLFLQGGASTQFAAIPLNLLRHKNKADYLQTGSWSKKAIVEAKRFCEVNIVASGEVDRYTSIPDPQTWELDPEAAYVHYVANETIEGVEFHWTPDVGDLPLVADMSSTILSRSIDVSQYGVIYAGAQKNIGPAGVTIVIVREDLIGHARVGVPAMLDYKINADADSMYNTPPTYAWYIAGLVFKWIKAQGGLSALGELNQRKANTLYATIDGSDFYTCPVDRACRSWMNVPFVLADKALDATFLSQAKETGLVTLKGHRSVGGMRASIYNAMPEQGIAALVQFMRDFEQRHA